VGNVDNTKLAEIVAEALGFRLQDATGRLFVDVASAFPNGYSVDTSDKTNPVLVIGDHRLPVNKDLLVKGDKTYNLEGIIIQATEPEPDNFYIPAQAIRCIRERICPK
jgi:alkaline phosphatase